MNTPLHFPLLFFRKIHLWAVKLLRTGGHLDSQFVGDSLLTMLVCMVLSIMGAYALSSLRWPRRNLFGYFCWSHRCCPRMLVLIPHLRRCRSLSLLNFTAWRW
jgi:hypothetical protein